jgi:transcriptional regulator of heat shock response
MDYAKYMNLVMLYMTVSETHRKSKILSIPIKFEDSTLNEKIAILTQAIQQKKLIQQMGKVGLWDKQLEKIVNDPKILDDKPVF